MEPVRFIGQDVYDADGNLVPGSGDVELVCDVLPAGATGFSESDHFGLTDNLDIYAPAGTVVNVGDRLEVRGISYTVTKKPFDWAHGRRPRACPGHRPRVQIFAEMVEIDG